MGTKLKEIIVKHEVSLEDLRGKVLVVDSHNVLYQFLTSIRQADGTPLQDSKGNITSHLVGLFNRTTKLMQYGIKLVFVFDGEAPKLKAEERKRRAALKIEAQTEYDIAKDREDIDGMKKFASRTTRLTPEMIVEAKELIFALGLPIINAPSEGEAQAAFMVKNGDAYASVSQDYDSLLFGVPKLIQNLTISEKRKIAGKLGFSEVKPEIIDLKENLKELNLNQDELIVLGVLIGTDFNYGGIKGIGPKKALKALQSLQVKSDFESIFKTLEWEKYFEFSWKEVFDTIKDMPTISNYSLKWSDPNIEKIKELLCTKHEFSTARVDAAIEKLIKEKEKNTQKGLGDFFK